MSLSVGHAGRGVLSFGVVLVVLQAFPVLAQTASPVIGSLNMPSVTPEQAQQYLSSRIVPAGTSIVPAPSDAAAPLAKLDVDNTLGHDLPQGDTTPYGFKRADFATAAANAADTDKKRRQQMQGTAGLAKHPATAIISEEPPALGGKP